MKLGAKGWLRGNEIRYDEDTEKWLYSDTLTPIDDEPDRPCAKCGKHPTLEGYDACMGYIEGASSACCGHGISGKNIQYNDGMWSHEVIRCEIDEIRDDRVKYYLSEYGHTGCGSSFDELLCHDLHTTDGKIYGGYDFKEFAERWGISLEILGELLLDHCYALVGQKVDKIEITVDGRASEEINRRYQKEFGI